MDEINAMAVRNVESNSRDPGAAQNQGPARGRYIGRSRNAAHASAVRHDIFKSCKVKEIYGSSLRDPSDLLNFYILHWEFYIGYFKPQNVKYQM